MAQVGWFMYQRWDDTPIGVFTNEDQAKNVANNQADGEYVLVPIEANHPYGDLLDEDLPGATIYRSQGLEARVASVENDLIALDAELTNTKSQAQAKFNQIDGRLDNHDTSITDLQTRVAALEGG